MASDWKNKQTQYLKQKNKETDVNISHTHPEIKFRQLSGHPMD